MDKVYTTKQIAKILQVDWRTVLNYIKSGKLKAFKLGRRYRIEDKDLRKFIDERKA